MSLLERCPLFRVSFIERFHCISLSDIRMYLHSQELFAAYKTVDLVNLRAETL